SCLYGRAMPSHSPSTIDQTRGRKAATGSTSVTASAGYAPACATPSGSSFMTRPSDIHRLRESNMAETIRLGWGASSLGEFMVAISGTGLVALEFSSEHLAAEAALRARFPEATVVHDQAGLSGVIEKARQAVEDPHVDPAIALDLRGTPYQVRVWLM